MLSGVGPAEHLQEFGIQTLVDSPGVGANLDDHVEGIVQWDAKKPMIRHSTQWWEIGLFATSEEGLDRPDLMMHYGSVPFDMNTARWGYPTTENGFCLTPNVCRGRSRGTVRLRSSDYRDRARVDPRYFTDPDGHDERVMAFGMRLARKIVSQPPMAEWAGAELAPGPDAQTDDELIDYMHKTHNTVYHPACTAHMGPDSDPTGGRRPAPSRARRALAAHRRRIHPPVPPSDQPVHHDDDGRREVRRHAQGGRAAGSAGRRPAGGGLSATPRRAARDSPLPAGPPSVRRARRRQGPGASPMAVEIEEHPAGATIISQGADPVAAPASRAHRRDRDRPRRRSCSTCSARASCSVTPRCCPGCRPDSRPAPREDISCYRIDAEVAREPAVATRPGCGSSRARCSSGRAGRRPPTSTPTRATPRIEPVGALMRGPAGRVRSGHADPRRRRER